MSPRDLIYSEVYKQCIAAGLNEYVAKEQAAMALQKFKNGQYVSPQKLIKQSVVDAKKMMKKKNR